MKPAQTGLLLGLAYSMPVVVWTLTQAAATHSGSFDAAVWASQVLLILQATAVALWTPWYGRESPWASALTGMLLLILVPLPLITILWLTGTWSLTVIARAEVTLLIFAAALLFGIRALARLPVSSITSAIAQLVGIVGLWAFRDDWLGWLRL